MLHNVHCVGLGVWIQWTGTVEWNGGMDRTGLDWTGMEWPDVDLAAFEKLRELLKKMRT